MYYGVKLLRLCVSGVCTSFALCGDFAGYCREARLLHGRIFGHFCYVRLFVCGHFLITFNEFNQLTGDLFIFVLFVSSLLTVRRSTSRIVSTIRLHSKSHVRHPCYNLWSEFSKLLTETSFALSANPKLVLDQHEQRTNGNRISCLNLMFRLTSQVFCGQREQGADWHEWCDTDKVPRHKYSVNSAPLQNNRTSLLLLTSKLSAHHNHKCWNIRKQSEMMCWKKIQSTVQSIFNHPSSFKQY